MHFNSFPRLLLGLLLPLIAFAESNNLEKLSTDRIWLSLLFFNGKKSDITDPSFFLYKKEDWTPQKELEATIKNYDASLPDDPNFHPRCRFPARYYWLSKYVKFKNYTIIAPYCKNLQKALIKSRVNSISIILASSYLGNPASSFGHSFIKLNQATYKSDLLDYTINYGAKVPKNENIFRYIFRGVFGLYKAHFQDRFFYSQDFIYSNLEKRDLWEYELDLTPRQTLFLQLHLWEILNKDFEYLFFTKNCGYEVAKSIEVVLPQNIPEPHLWYAPKESVYMLESLQMVKKTKYHPAADKVLLAHYNELSKPVQNKINEYLPNDYRQLLQLQIDKEEKRKLLEFLLAYYNYKAFKTKKRFQKEKYEVLKARLLLPPAKPSAKITTPLPPHETSKLSLVQFLKTEDDVFGSYSPYFDTPLAYGGAFDHSLQLFHFTLSKNEKKLDIIEVYQFNTQKLPFEKEHTFSWKIKISYDKHWYADFGIGKRVYSDANLLIYLLPHIIIQKDPTYDLESGIIIAFKKFRAQAKIHTSYTSSLSLNYYFTPNLAFSQQYVKDSYRAGIVFYF